MSDDEDRRSSWQFIITDTGWMWMVKHPEGGEENSNRAFKTLKECADDAREHGYAAWKAGERRTVEPKPFSNL